MRMIITLFVTGVFTSNLVTYNLLGIDSLHSDNKTSLSSVLKNGFVVTVVLLLSTTICQPLNNLVLSPLKLGYLAPLTFVLVIFGILLLLRVLSSKFLPKAFMFLKENIKVESVALIALGLCLIAFEYEVARGYAMSLLYSVICGVGYTVVSLMFFAINKRLAEVKLPEAVKGLPITLLIAALISLAFGGLAGL
ncbi:MAG: hypothetical protein J6Q74_02530 [Clostridia bacterium]|nr:hypothetical protein [Clostridia bacterium]